MASFLLVEIGSDEFLPWLALNCDPPDLCLPSRITCMNHSVWLGLMIFYFNFTPAEKIKDSWLLPTGDEAADSAGLWRSQLYLSSMDADPRSLLSLFLTQPWPRSRGKRQEGFGQLAIVRQTWKLSALEWPLLAWKG
jgi:hypothetical protein